jgi:hypothetical protein
VSELFSNLQQRLKAHHFVGHRRVPGSRCGDQNPTGDVQPPLWISSPPPDFWRGNLFRLMTPAQQQALFENTARAMGDARLHIKERHIRNCWRADPAYGEGVARALGIDVKQAVE